MYIPGGFSGFRGFSIELSFLLFTMVELDRHYLTRGNVLHLSRRILVKLSN